MRRSACGRCAPSAAASAGRSTTCRRTSRASGRGSPSSGCGTRRECSGGADELVERGALIAIYETEIVDGRGLSLERVLTLVRWRGPHTAHGRPDAVTALLEPGSPLRTAMEREAERSATKRLAELRRTEPARLEALKARHLAMAATSERLAGRRLSARPVRSQGAAAGGRRPRGAAAPKRRRGGAAEGDRAGGQRVPRRTSAPVAGGGGDVVSCEF